MTPPVASSTTWIADGTAFFLARAAQVDVAASSALPGWTNGHVLAHIARNAEGIGRLLTWVRTGVPTPMYESAAARAADIERDAGRPFDVQLADIRATAADLDTSLAAVPDTAWHNEVRMVSGRVVPGPGVPWLRVKEVWLHALDIGAEAADLPADVVAAVMHDVVSSFDARADAPALRLIAEDADGSVARFEVHSAGVEVTGTAAGLLVWLTGRSTGEGVRCATTLPELPNWA